MLILGLDPGSRHTGYGVIEVRGSDLRAMAWGRISCPASLPLPDRLAHLSEGVGALVERWRPAAAVLETPYQGVNARSLIVLAEARGALLAALARHPAGLPMGIREYTPAQVKTAVTGNGRAEKGQVARMVRILLSLEHGGTSPDATDALAVAICFAHRHRLEGLAERPAARG